MTVKSLDELRLQIAVDRVEPIRTNLISQTLRSISQHYGVAAANKAIRQYGLNKLGWSEQVGEEPVALAPVGQEDPLDRVMREP